MSSVIASKASSSSEINAQVSTYIYTVDREIFVLKIFRV